MTKQRIEVLALARVEGEGGMYIGVKDGLVDEIRVDIYEPPRFFEGFLRDRYMQEVPDITARICGICPVAYQMSSVYALERAVGYTITPSVRELRRLLYCGEYIESHALHIYMLQAPDLLKVDSVLQIAEIAPEVVKDALRMKKIGNEILRIIGGRSVHPVSACVGGFYSFPKAKVFKAMLPDLKWGLEKSKETVRWAMTLDYPEMEVDYEFVALHHPTEYAIIEGEILSSKRGITPIDKFEEVYPEQHVRHSNAIHSQTTDGEPYFVGPMARLNLNAGQLGPEAKAIMEEVGLELPIVNPYKNLIARAVEMVDAFDLAIQLIENYHPQGLSHPELTPKAGSGMAATEAPRGLLFHRYTINNQGFIQEARIIPPTAQNLARMEADLWQIAPEVIDLPEADASLACEHLIRSYDPCISCATHFLRLTIDRI
jgi:coenzyme F420-reducing hydrogenase alpha subunit